MDYIQVAEIKAWYALKHPKTIYVLFTISYNWTSDVNFGNNHIFHHIL